MEYVSDKIFFNGIKIKSKITCDDSYEGCNEDDILKFLEPFEDKQLGLYTLALSYIIMLDDYTRLDIMRDLDFYSQSKVFSKSDLELFYTGYKGVVFDFNLNGVMSLGFDNNAVPFQLVTHEILKTIFKIKVIDFSFGPDGPVEDDVKFSELVFKIK